MSNKLVILAKNGLAREVSIFKGKRGFNHGYK